MSRIRAPGSRLREHQDVPVVAEERPLPAWRVIPSSPVRRIFGMVTPGRSDHLAADSGTGFRKEKNEKEFG